MIPSFLNSQTTQILQWNFIHPISKQVFLLGEKGSVQEGLIANGLMPDPFHGTNENEFGWIEEHEWTLTSSFEWNGNENDYLVDLFFPNVDTYAQIFLNDELIQSTDNYFHPYRIAVQDKIKKGKNELRVVFTPPVLYHKKAFETRGYQLPTPNDLNKVAIAPYSRKPQYQFGWDWALRMVNMGFDKPVELKSYAANYIVSKNIQTISITEGIATLKLEVELRNKAHIHEWKSKIFGNVKFTQYGTKLSATVTLDNPKLWWPKGQGEAFLYSDEWNFEDKSKHYNENMKVRFGVKTSELIQEKDNWGTSFELKINGRKVFCKGGDYIPQDIFPARVTDNQIKEMVALMAESNFNMVRVWGGGYYPEEVFFETCDELGIMVWQDFMFACAMYPGDDAFLKNVKNELSYQIPRIGSHPSVVLFNGNNEVDVAWKNWGFQVKYLLIGKSVKEIESAYQKLFKELVPSCVGGLTSIPYEHTSPLSNWGKDEFYNHGTQHYWGVWHGKDPLEDFGKKIGRFNAEFGFQSFPEYQTLLSFSTENDWSIDSEVMKHHQKSYVGNAMISKHSDKLYGKAKDFEQFVYFSQLTQARAVGVAVSGHRIDMPRCSGTLYWQVNDCWPGPTWSSVDYFGNWKALQYEVKTDFKGITVLAKEESIGKRNFYLVSDYTEKVENTVKATVYSVGGEVLEIHEFTKTTEGNAVVAVPFEKLISPKLTEYVLEIEWRDEYNEPQTRIFPNVSSTTKKADSSSYKLEVVNKNGEQFIAIDNNSLMQDVWFYSKTKKIHLNENFKTLLPGKYVFKLTSLEEINTEDILIQFR